MAMLPGGCRDRGHALAMARPLCLNLTLDGERSPARLPTALRAQRGRRAQSGPKGRAAREGAEAVAVPKHLRPGPRHLRYSTLYRVTGGGGGTPASVPDRDPEAHLPRWPLPTLTLGRRLRSAAPITRMKTEAWHGRCGGPEMVLPDS